MPLFPCRIVLSFVVFCAALGRLAAADLPFLHQLFTDHAVLQRDIRIPVWGWTSPGTSVQVSVDGGPAQTGTAAGDGRWQVMIGPFPAGGPHTVSVRSADKQVSISDVLFGDVWICSGQSNMEFNMGQTKNAEAEIASADNDQIRLFSNPKFISLTPRHDSPSQWSLCTKGSIGGFSAVGYFFGRDVQKAIKIPIGLISSAWGGTPAETWVSPEALSAIDDFKAPLENLTKTIALIQDPNAAQLVFKELDAWYEHNDPGTVAHWAAPETADADWKTMELPTYWETVGYPNFDGICWFRREVTLPDSWIGQDMLLHLGAVDDRDTTYVNGTRVGGHDSAWEARDYTIPAALLKAGRNVIAVRVLDTGGNGGIYGSRDMRLESKGQTPIPIAGPWRCHFSTEWTACTQPVPENPMDQNDPNRVSRLYNGMICELLPFAIKGVIWYQGESNAGRGMQYRKLMPALIKDWRSRFNVGDFPFYQVQLANFMNPDDSTTDSSWAELREAQSMTAFSLPHCGVALAIDVGDAKDIHPKNKQEVGHRLALNALAQTYGEPIEYQGPVWKGLKIEGQTVRLTYDHLGGGLVIHDYDGTPQTTLRGFAVAGADHHYVVADAHIDGDQVVLSAAQVAQPVSVRYDWGNNPPGNLYNKAGLPAVPFRSDSPP